MSTSMDISNTVGRVYAGALLDIGQDHGNLDEILDELTEVHKRVRTSKEFRFIFESPQVAREVKIKMLEDVFGDKLSRMTFNLLKLLIRKQRELALNNILEQFIYLRDVSEHRVRADITFAADVGEAVRARLKSKLEEITGKTVVITFRVDPALLGGLTARVGDLYLDGSVAGRLKRLRKRISTYEEYRS